MKKRGCIFQCTICLLMTVAAGSYIFAYKTNSTLSCKVFKENRSSAISHDIPVATVTADFLHRDNISETIIAYGTVKPLPGKIYTFDVPYDCLIRKINVTEGQIVHSGDVLLELSPAPDVLLQMEQLRSELVVQHMMKKMLQERLGLKLATHEDLLMMQGRIKQLEQHLDNLNARGISAQKKICALADGIVCSINSSAGKLLSAGVNLIQVVDKEQIIISFGVEPEDIMCLKKGLPIEIISTGNQKNHKVPGSIYTVTHQVDPSSRLVTVLARPDITEGLLFNDFVEVRIIIARHEAFVVPRTAVLPDDKGFFLFTVKNGRAVRHDIDIGLEAPERIEIMAKDLTGGDKVIIAGNYELTDGMHVKVVKNR